MNFNLGGGLGALGAFAQGTRDYDVQQRQKQADVQRQEIQQFAFDQEKDKAARDPQIAKGYLDLLNSASDQPAMIPKPPMPGQVSTPMVQPPPQNQPPSGAPPPQDRYALADAKYRFPPGTMRAVSKNESSGDPNAVSPKGAQGEFGVMPGTQKDPGYGLPPINKNDPISAGAYLAKMVQLSNGDFNLGLARYNAGPKGDLNNPETINYVKRINMDLRGGQQRPPQSMPGQQPPQAQQGAPMQAQMPQQGQSQQGQPQPQQAQQAPQIPPYRSMSDAGQPPQQDSQIGAPPKLDFQSAIATLAKRGITDPQTVLAILDKNQARLSTQAQAQLAYQKQVQSEQDRIDRLQETGRHNREMESIGQTNAGTRETAAKNANGIPSIPGAGSDLHGDDYLKTLPPGVAATVKQIAEGRGSLTSLSTKGGHREAILAMVNQYKPDFDAKDYGTESTGEKAFTSGKQGNSIRSFNTGLLHLDTLAELGSALKNNDLNVFNKVANQISSEWGGAAVTNFEGAKQMVADEVVKAIVGSGGGVSDREAAAKTISAARSPEQLLGIIDTYKKLFNGQIEGLQKQYEASTKKKDFKERFLIGGSKDSPSANAIVLSSASELQSAIKSGKLKKGDTFNDPDGNSHVVN